MPKPTSSPKLLRAFGDESFREAPDGGYYVLAAAVYARTVEQQVRDVMREQLGTLKARKWHWTEMDAKHRLAAARALAQLGGIHVVTVGTPVPRRRQERARALCLQRLVHELHGYGVGALVLEGRTAQLNRRDIKTVAGARFQLPKGTRFTVSHANGTAEPLLWAADIVAGAVRASREGDRAPRMLLDQLIYDVEVETGC